MRGLLNHLQERILVQQKHLLPDQEGGFKEEWQHVGYLWVKRALLYPGRQRVGHVTLGHRLGAKHLEETVYVFSARNEIPIKVGMRLKGARASYTVLEDAQEQASRGWQQFCGVKLKAHERGER